MFLILMDNFLHFFVLCLSCYFYCNFFFLNVKKSSVKLIVRPILYYHNNHHTNIININYVNVLFIYSFIYLFIYLFIHFCINYLFFGNLLYRCVCREYPCAGPRTIKQRWRIRCCTENGCTFQQQGSQSISQRMYSVKK